MRTVFVYGSLMKGFGNHVLLKESTFVSSATLSGMLMYSLGGFPAILPRGKRTDIVYGEVYEVDDETLAALDRLEGHPRFYERQEHEVFVENYNAWMPCYVYIFQQPVDDDSYIESGSWRHATQVQESPVRG